jgi:AraC-like DNA-binding protein
VEVTRRVKTDERLRKALDLIAVRYNTSLTVEEIARDVCLSPSRLCHIVQSELGLTLRAYITKVRVGKAKVLLLGTNMSISQIALEVGYPDQSYFTKAFKSIENCTPMTFRKSGFLTGFGRGLASIR